MKNDFGREQRALKGIKTIVDAYKKGSIKITVGNDDFDMNNHTYDIKTIMAYIQNYVCEGLDLPIPSSKTNKGGEMV